MTAEVRRPGITVGIERLVERLNEVQNVSCPLINMHLLPGEVVGKTNEKCCFAG